MPRLRRAAALLSALLLLQLSISPVPGCPMPVTGHGEVSETASAAPQWAAGHAMAAGHGAADHGCTHEGAVPHCASAATCAAPPLVMSHAPAAPEGAGRTGIPSMPASAPRSRTPVPDHPPPRA